MSVSKRLENIFCIFLKQKVDDRWIPFSYLKIQTATVFCMSNDIFNRLHFGSLQSNRNFKRNSKTQRMQTPQLMCRFIQPSKIR